MLVLVVNELLTFAFIFKKYKMLHYRTFTNAQSKEWVVFVHGAGGSSAVWFKQVKFFQQYFNLLLIDLRGHGASPQGPELDHTREYTFNSIADDIIEVMNDAAIEKAHFIGVSLGTIIIRQLAEMASERINSMILVGAVTGLDMRSKFWVNLGRMFRHILPPMWLYKLFARVIMPDNRQSESRLVFINEAKKLARREFLRWFRLTGELTGVLNKFQKMPIDIPTLYVMGENDYLFLDQVKQITANTKNQILEIVEQCGHVVNIERPDIFNKTAIAFLIAQIRGEQYSTQVLKS
jgi:pimeloyl-ACP methyl ester carboxylesterase